MLRPLCALVLLTAHPAAAQLDPLLAPHEVERQAGTALPFGAAEEDSGARPQGAVLMPRLVQFNFVDANAAPLTDGPLLAARLAPFLNRPLTEGALDAITDSIVDYYAERDQPVMEVFVPEQDLADGTLRIEVVEGRVGLVGLEKTRFFNDELLAGSVRLQRGEPLRASRLEEQQDWLNRNPFRGATLYAAPGEGFAEADLLYSLEERFPLRAYLGYENTGTPSVGRNRWFAGANWGNGFGQDHLLSYQFTVGDSLSDFQSHSMLWEVPLHRLHHFLRFGGAWADVSSQSTSGGIAVVGDGTTWQVSAAYGMQLPRRHGFTQDLSMGAEFKTSDNFLVFGGTSPGNSVVDIVQARLDYSAARRGEDDALQFSASLVASPGDLSSHNTDADFEEFRSDAEAQYLYARLRATWLRRLPEQWSLRLAGEAQWANGALLPIEQLALGGRDTVRGYEERIALADSGYQLSAELRTPAITLPGESLSAAQAQFLLFLDHGTGWTEDAGHESLTGAGGGLRLQAGSFGDLRFDLGWPLEGGDGPQAHISLLLSF